MIPAVIVWAAIQVWLLVLLTATVFLADRRSKISAVIASVEIPEKIRASKIARARGTEQQHVMTAAFAIPIPPMTIPNAHKTASASGVEVPAPMSAASVMPTLPTTTAHAIKIVRAFLAARATLMVAEYVTTTPSTTTRRALKIATMTGAEQLIQIAAPAV